MIRPLVLAFAVLWAAPALASPPPHHDLSLTLAPDAARLSATDVLRVEGAGPLSFALAPGMEVEAIAVDGTARPASREEVDLGAAGTHTVTITYSGALAPLPEGRGGLDRPMGGPDGIYLPAGIAWMPDLGIDTFTFRVRVSVPDPWKAVTVGRLTSEGQEGGIYTAVYESEMPQDAIPLMAGRWEVAEKRHKGILLRTWFDADNAPDAADYLRLTAEYIDLYSDWIGTYPFSAFHIVSAPLPVGYGFPGLTYIGARVLRLPFIRHTSLGHEILHNWWGNGVYVDYASGNWCEGLTTFMADYTYALRQGDDAARDKRLAWLRDFAALPPDRDRPVRAFVTKAHDAAQVVGYGKVAFLFHMLRQEVGEPAFDAALRRFWTDRKFTVAGWDDLRAAFEAETGRDLGRFFAQWLDRAGAPTLHLKDARADDGTVSFTLTQDAPPYALSVPVAVDGRRRVVPIEGAETPVTLETEGRAHRLAIDPDADLFRHLDPAESPSILRDVTLDARTVVVAKTETAAHLAARMMDTEPVFGEPRDGRPLLVIGQTGAAAQAGLGPPPGEVAGKGTARVWTGRRDGVPFAVIEADDDAALAALLRPLPHYLRRGYLVFDGARAVIKGSWPPGGGALTVLF